MCVAFKGGECGFGVAGRRRGSGEEDEEWWSGLTAGKCGRWRVEWVIGIKHGECKENVGNRGGGGESVTVSRKGLQAVVSQHGAFSFTVRGVFQA